MNGMFFSMVMYSCKEIVMRRLGIYALFAVVLVWGFQVHSAPVDREIQETPLSTNPGAGLEATDDTLFFETFENGAPNWQRLDLTDFAAWQKTTFNAFEGMSWWAGDTLIEGYDNHWLQYLDSPVLDLSGATNPNLTFNVFYALEDPLGPFPTGYDAWDGANVWISTDGGNNFQVLNVNQPPYEASSVYSFGFEFGLGPGIPGWTGFSGGGRPGQWVNGNSSLANFTQNNVVLRFAFASDPAGSTINDSAFIGFFVDNIVIREGTTTYLANNADDLAEPADMIPRAGMVVGTAWHLEELTLPPPPSPPTVMAFSDTANPGYPPFAYSALVTPPIDLTTFSADSDSFFADFYHAGTINVGDPDPFPDVDYWTVQISPDNGANWYYWSNPFGQPGGQNFVFSSLPVAFQRWSETWQGAEDGIDLTPYIGSTVLVRILFQADPDQFSGTGMFVDNFWVEGTGALGVRPLDPGVVPREFSLQQNAPNPFNPSTTITFALTRNGPVRLSVYDLVGREVRRLLDGSLNAGSYQVDFHAGGLASGVYLYRLEAEGLMLQNKMVLLK